MDKGDCRRLFLLFLVACELQAGVVVAGCLSPKAEIVGWSSFEILCAVVKRWCSTSVADDMATSSVVERGCSASVADDMRTCSETAKGVGGCTTRTSSLAGLTSTGGCDAVCSSSSILESVWLNAG